MGKNIFFPGVSAFRSFNRKDTSSLKRQMPPNFNVSVKMPAKPSDTVGKKLIL